jgi:hypothetical protein
VTTIAGLIAYIPYASIAVSLLAAVLGIRAATIPIRESLDHIMMDIGRQGKWASWTALTAAAAAVLQSVDRFLQ